MVQLGSGCKAQPAHKALRSQGFLLCLLRHCGSLLLRSALSELVIAWELYSVVLSGLLIAGVDFNDDFCRHDVNTIVI